jgi:hypothetical protein
MTNGDEYGDDTYGGIRLTTAVTGSAGAETIDTANGETLYLIANKVRGKYGFLQKIKEISSTVSIGTRSGVKSRKISVTDVVILRWTNAGHVSVADNTAAMNAIMDWIDGKHDAGDAPFYLFVYNYIDSKYVKLQPNAHTYLKGAVTNIEWELGPGNVYYFKSFEWSWVS